MIRSIADNIEFVKGQHTGKEWCECICDMLTDQGLITVPRPEEIWNYSPKGELSLVMELIDMAKEYWESKTEIL